MRKITYGIIIATTALLATSLVARAPQSTTAAAKHAVATIDPQAMQINIDGIESLPRLPDYPN